MSPRFTTLCLSALAATIVLTLSWMAAADHTALSGPAVIMAAASGLALLVAAPACAGYAVAWACQAGKRDADRATRHGRPLPIAPATARHRSAPATMAQRTVAPPSTAPEQPARRWECAPDPVIPDAELSSGEWAVLDAAMAAPVQDGHTEEMPAVDDDSDQSLIDELVTAGRLPGPSVWEYSPVGAR